MNAPTKWIVAAFAALGLSSAWAADQDPAPGAGGVRAHGVSVTQVSSRCSRRSRAATASARARLS